MLPHFQPQPRDVQAEGEEQDSSSDSSSDEEEDGDSDVGDPFEDVAEGECYAFKVRDHGQEARLLHRRVVR